MTARHLHPVAYAPARHRHQRRLTGRSLWLFVRRFRWYLAAGLYLALLLWFGDWWRGVQEVRGW